MSSVQSEVEPEANADPAELQNALQEKVNEYGILVAPVEQAIRDMQFVRGMMRARAEDEINAISPPLAALTEALGISTLDLLTAEDRATFLREAVARAQIPVEEIRRRVLEASSDAHEDLLALGIPDGE